MAADGVSAFFAISLSICLRSNSAIRLSPCSDRKPSRIPRYVACVVDESDRNAVELKYPITAAFTVPGRVRLAPTSMRGASPASAAR